MRRHGASRGGPLYPGERFNSATHAAGLVLAAIGTPWLLTRAAATGDAWKIASAGIFGAALVAMYLASTLFHALQGAAKSRWATFDHCAIYLLVAGTYTPIALVVLHGATGWCLFAAVWAMAAVGLDRELRAPTEKPPLVLYLAMGWVGLAAAVPLVRALPGDGAWWLLGGALLYTVGVVFYAGCKRWPHAHGVWHLFVLGGSSAHFMTVYRFVL